MSGWEFQPGLVWEKMSAAFAAVVSKMYGRAALCDLGMGLGLVELLCQQNV
jgi:hypothetical protein